MAMSAIVKMFRGAGTPSGGTQFSCPTPIWDLLWELGSAFGWQPTGTTYVMPAKSISQMPARRNYQPGGSRDLKQVEEQDAVAWARALEVAKASPHFATMIEARSAELLPGMLDEFIEFAYGGAFEFSISEPA
jgi:hypothetical protein